MFQEYIEGDANRLIEVNGQENHDLGKKENVYQANGFKNRKEYLSDLADQYGVPEYVVFSIAEMLSESEDFEGLIVELEEHALMFV